MEQRPLCIGGKLMPEKGKKKLDLRSFRWILPYKRIRSEIERNGGVIVTVSSEGEAFDVQLWARLRGYRIVKTVRYTGGIDIDIEKPAAPPAPAPPAAQPQAAAPAAAPAPRPAPAGKASVRVVGDIERASSRLQEPIIRADLLLSSKGSRRGTIQAPATLGALVDAAIKDAGGDCVVLSIKGLTGITVAEVAACEDGVYAAYAEGDIGVVYGQKAIDAIEEALSKTRGTVSYTATIVGRDFMAKLAG